MSRPQAHALVIGSRGSALALRQAQGVKAALERSGCAAEIEIIQTTGDRMTDVPLAKVGTKGMFTREIEEALLAGRVHLAVHSLKDLPTQLPAGVFLAAVPEREAPRDALVSRHGLRFGELPRGARLGTSSLRRAAQLRALRPDVEVVPLRGNLDTRLRKLDQGNAGQPGDSRLDAIVLAAAGLKRLGWQDRITEFFSPELMCPAVGQGALGIEARADDRATLEALAALDNRAARLETAAERALLAALGGGCQVPIGAGAQADERGRLSLHAVVAAPDGSLLLRASGEGDDPAELGARLARELLRDGARRILEEVYGRAVPVAEIP